MRRNRLSLSRRSAAASLRGLMSKVEIMLRTISVDIQSVICILDRKYYPLARAFRGVTYQATQVNLVSTEG